MLGMKYGKDKYKAGVVPTYYRRWNTMKKKNMLTVAAAVAVLTMGVATFAAAAKTGFTCCQTEKICCQLKQACCQYWKGMPN